MLISQRLIDGYSAGPSASRTTGVKSLQESVRAALSAAEGSKFDTFLQGSHRNGTAIADINDVDIVALYDPWQRPKSNAEWNWLFNRVASILRSSPNVTGSVTIGDKCVKLVGALRADIVPAISVSTYSSSDPLYIYSRQMWEERPNYPRTHYDNGVKKQKATADTFKATVRLFKRWARQYPDLNAPSFYIECAVHSVENDSFDDYLPISFVAVALKISRYTRYSVIKSVAGDKDILTADEWPPDDFERFQQKLLSDTKLILRAMQADSQVEADRLWKLAFGE